MSFRYLITQYPSYNSSGWNYNKPSMYLYAYDESRKSKGYMHVRTDWLRLFHTDKANYEEQKKQIKKNIEKAAKETSFSKGMSVKAANELIDKVCRGYKRKTDSVDAGVENILKQQEKHGYLYDQYVWLDMFMSRANWISSGALKEILGVQKQNPFKRAQEYIQNGNNDKKEAAESFSKLDARFKKFVKHFIEQHNYDIHGSWSEWIDVQHDLFNKIESLDPNRKNIIEPDIVFSRVEQDLLRSELQYKYFKQTGNPEIFVSAKEKQRLEQLSDKDLLEECGRFGLLYHKDAYVIGERMKKFGKDIKALDAFCGYFEKISRDTMPNQDVVKMYFEILKQNANKFIVKNFEDYKGLYYFIRVLHSRCESEKIKQEMSEVFGKNVVSNLYRYGVSEQEKEAKNRVKNNLRQVSERLQKGEYVSGAVIATDIADLISDYDVKLTDQTAKKVMSKKRLSNVQQSVLKRYKTRG